MKQIALLSLATAVSISVTLNATLTYEELLNKTEAYVSFINAVGSKEMQQPTAALEAHVAELFASNCTKIEDDIVLYESRDGILPQLFNAKETWKSWKIVNDNSAESSVGMNGICVFVERQLAVLTYTLFAAEDILDDNAPLVYVTKMLKFDNDGRICKIQVTSRPVFSN